MNKKTLSIAAAILQREGELGTVRAGALADLLLVDGNPLADIGLIAGQGERLSVVMQAGRIHRREG